MRRLHNTLQNLAVVDTAVDNFKPQGLMHVLSDGVVNPGIGGHLDAPPAPRPIFTRGQELFAHPFSAVDIEDKPTFEETHRTPRIATVGMRAQTDFEETNQHSVGSFSNENHEWQCSAMGSRKNRSELYCVFFGRRFWPQRLSQMR
jgi:hypothetical protein